MHSYLTDPESVPQSAEAMAVFERRPANRILLDDTAPLTCNIEGHQQREDHTVGVAADGGGGGSLEVCGLVVGPFRYTKKAPSMFFVFVNLVRTFQMVWFCEARIHAKQMSACLDLYSLIRKFQVASRRFVEVSVVCIC